eukprot:14515916-Ditylum_brightwellii.AAC.1
MLNVAMVKVLHCLSFMHKGVDSGGNESDIFLEQFGQDDFSWDHFTLWLLAGGVVVTGQGVVAHVGGVGRCLTAGPGRNEFSSGCALPLCRLDSSMKVCGDFAL